MTLAYVFWHWPAEPDGYEERMQAFHSALGRPGTATFRLERAPFEDPAAPFEDWYPVEDWTALGELNDFAVTGARKAPHDAVAKRARRGAGAVYRQLRDGAPLQDVRFAAWLHPPPAVVEGEGIWQRQRGLGRGPEYAVLAGSPVDVEEGAILTSPRVVARA